MKYPVQICEHKVVYTKSVCSIEAENEQAAIEQAKLTWLEGNWRGIEKQHAKGESDIDTIECLDENIADMYQNITNTLSRMSVDLQQDIWSKLEKLLATAKENTDTELIDIFGKAFSDLESLVSYIEYADGYIHENYFNGEY